jgi:hypothetical protein
MMFRFAASLTFAAVPFAFVRVPVTCALLAGSLAALAAAAGPAGAQTPRQRQVEQRGQSVMPFDQRRTVHVFRELPDGGVQRVVAKDQRDAGQVALVRAHLRAEARRFAHGDFGDPAAIHGGAMPGLAELARGYESVHVTYADVPGGGAIRYASADPRLVAALHRWFAAQSADHGAHAVHMPM